MATPLDFIPYSSSSSSENKSEKKNENETKGVTTIEINSNENKIDNDNKNVNGDKNIIDIKGDENDENSRKSVKRDAEGIPKQI